MKKTYVLIILFLAGLSSCNKVMDTKPLDKYTGSDIWGNYSLAQGFIFTCYSNIVGGYMTNWSDDILTKDMVNEPWGGSFVSEKTEQMDKFSDEGWSNFGNIRSVNLAIQNLQTAPFTSIQKNTLLGEAYFLRGITYFIEARKFGGVQVVKQVLTPSGNFAIGRSTLKETYDFILSDLDSAAVLLPSTNDRGRATNGAAYAMIMRAALQAGAYLNDKSYYQQVTAAGNKLFALGQYSLDTYSNLFNTYNSAIGSSENILVSDNLAINTSFASTPMQYIVPNSAPTGKLTGIAASLFPLV